MAIDGRVQESLRRRLCASHPLVIDGAHDLDGCWALDHCVDDSGSPTVVQQVLDDVRSMPEQRATMAVAARMAEHLQRYRWPSDLVVSPVPSHDPVVALLARAVAVHLEVPCVPLLRLRWSRSSRSSRWSRWSVGSSVRAAHVERRIAVRARLVPAHVLLIDDLVTTGRTLRVCSTSLRARGAQAVWAMVAAADVRTDLSFEPGTGPGADLDDRSSAPPRIDGAPDVEVRRRGHFTDVWSDLAELADEPVVAGEPVDEEPMVEEPVNDEPVNDEPVDEEPVNEEPVIDEPGGDDRGVARAHRRQPKRRNRRAHRR